MQTYKESTIIDKDINSEHKLERVCSEKCISQKFNITEQNGGLHKIPLALLITNIIKNSEIQPGGGYCYPPPAPPTFSSYYFFLGLYISLIVKNSAPMSYNISKP